MNARNRELVGLIPASLLVTAGFAGVFIQRSNALSNVSLTYGAIFLGLCIATHILIRVTLPHADPYLFPLAAALASFGIVMIYRIDAGQARQQAVWFIIGLILAAVTIVMFRDYRRLERYRYTIMAVSLGLMILPRIPGFGEQVNGAYLAIHIPGLGAFQPPEFAKIGLVIFLASYLSDTRQVLVMGARRVLGVTIPPIKHFGPVLVIWGIAMLILFILHDIGTSLMFYGGLLAVLYVATNRISFVVIGVIAFVIGAWYLGTHIAHIHARVETWLHPFDPRLYHAPLGSYQLANSIFSQAAGGLFGQGFGQAYLKLPAGGSLLPAAQTDMIYAVITNELGLFGAGAVLITYLLFVARGFKTALMARDSFSTLLAAGLTAMFGLQVFVIVGGVTRVIPLTGVTLPFISYGGSSIVANLVLLALLMLVSDRGSEAGAMNRPILRLFALLVILFALLFVWTSRWTVIDAASLNKNALNVRPLLAELQTKGGRILAADGTVLAKPVPGPGGTWNRTYPTGSLFAQAIGYSLPAQGRSAGLERFRAPELRGASTGLGSVFGPMTRRVGNDVYTTLDPKGQQAAQQALGGQRGSVVALDPRTGAVLVMYSNPSYDDNHIDQPGATTFNRATQGSYAPGSTFKIVTASAGVDSGRYNPNSYINGNSPLLVSGVPLNNDGNQSWGPVSLTTAMTYSINTVFAQVAETVGRSGMTDYMKKFGFYSKPPLDYPANELTSSTIISPSGRPYPPASPRQDIGRIGIGQGGVIVTPLQDAMSAAAVANGGNLMTPHMTSKIVNSDGATVETITPTVYQHVMSASSARAVTSMMEKVVEEGTGTTVQIPGVTIAGKTGTASIGASGSNLTQPSFVAFAPAEQPKVAIAVMVDQSQGGFGATVAAPIAKAVIQTLLSEGK